MLRLFSARTDLPRHRRHRPLKDGRGPGPDPSQTRDPGPRGQDVRHKERRRLRIADTRFSLGGHGTYGEAPRGEYRSRVRTFSPRRAPTTPVVSTPGRTGRPSTGPHRVQWPSVSSTTVATDLDGHRTGEGGEVRRETRHYTSSEPPTPPESFAEIHQLPSLCQGNGTFEPVPVPRSLLGCMIYGDFRESVVRVETQ